MPLTPEEIRHISIGRAVRGYDRRETDELLAEVASSYEAVWRQRADLVEQLKRADVEFRDLDERVQEQAAHEAALRQQLEQRTAELASVRHRATALESDRDALVADLERAKAEAADRPSLVDECKRLTAEVADVREDAARIAAERTRLLEQSERSEAVIAELRGTIAQLERRIHELTEESQRSGVQIEDLRRELAARNAEHSRLREDAERSRADLVELRFAERARALDLARTEDELRRRDAELADLRRDVQRLEIERAAGRDHVANVEAALQIHRQVAARLRELLLEDAEVAKSETRFTRRKPLTQGLSPLGELDDTPPTRSASDEEEDRQRVHSDSDLSGDLRPDALRETINRPERGVDLPDTEAPLTKHQRLRSELRSLMIENLRLLDGSRRQPDSEAVADVDAERESEGTPAEAPGDPDRPRDATGDPDRPRDATGSSQSE